MSLDLIDSALNLFFPAACTACGSAIEKRFDGVACAACWAETEFYTQFSYCWKCAEPLNPGVRAQATVRRCGQCDSQSFDAVRPIGIYEKALKASILNLKRKAVLAERIVCEASKLVASEPLTRAQVLVSVPLHPTRLRERGFNQADVIATALALRTGLPFHPDILERTRHSERHRAGMGVAQRASTVEKAFQVRKPRLIDGKNVLLIDDVVTTGATASACATALKKSGACEVYVLSLARPRPVK
jgi:ComF family protein